MMTTPSLEDHPSHDYDAIVEQYRREIHTHCYRMLASLHDADDALQETLIRAWRGLDGFAGRSSVRTWLYTIATNVCLRAIERRRRHLLPIDLGPDSTVSTATWEVLDVWPDPYPTGVETDPQDAAVRSESLGLAFIAAVQLLPASQRAVLLLRDALRFSARETGSILGMSSTAVNSSLQRARRTLHDKVVAGGSGDSVGELDPFERRRLVDRYVGAWESGDVQAVLDLFTDDAVFQMPPVATWFSGREAIAELLPSGPLRERWKLVPTEANGQLAFGCYTWDADCATFVPNSIDVIAVRDGRVCGLTAFLQPQLLRNFGLPEHLQPDDTNDARR